MFVYCRKPWSIKFSECASGIFSNLRDIVVNLGLLSSASARLVCFEA